MKVYQGKQSSELLVAYKSIWSDVEDDLERDLIRLELKKNHRRSMQQIKRVVAVKYWIQIVRWTMEEIRFYVPLLGGITLGILLLLIALS